MSMEFYDAVEVSSGMYEIIVTDVQELAQKWKLTLQPSQENIVFEDIFFWTDKKCSQNSLTYRLFSILGSKKKSVTIEEFRSKYLNKKVGVIVSDNTGKDGTLYHNIVQFFDITDWDNISSEYESEDSDEDEDYEDSDEDEDYEDSDEDEDYEDSDEDEDENSDEEDEEDGDDDFEDFVRPTSGRSGSKTIPRREEKHRKSNRR